MRPPSKAQWPLALSAALRWVLALLVGAIVLLIGLAMLLSGLTAAWLFIVLIVTCVILTVRGVTALVRRLRLKARLKTIVASLRRSDVFVPLNAPDDAAGPVTVRAARDKNGELWAYLYTDKAELVRALAPGSAYGVMSFAEAFRMISSSGAVRGILINSASDNPHLIFSEHFGVVDRALGERA